MPIVLATLSGCLWPEQVEPSNWMKQFKSQAIPPDHALIEFALIERPLGDEYINGRLWQHTDELIVDLEKRGLLDDNGFRVGQLVGAPPHDFQQLLRSPRSCSNPKALIFPTGKTAPIFFPLVQPQLAYEFVQGTQRTEVELDQARHCLDVTARFASDGRTILTFTPKVEHGAPALPFQAAPERSAWELQTGKAAQKYPELSWEVTLGPNQYVFVGGRLDRAKTLGQSAFTQADGAGAVQRLLVIRNCRSVTAAQAQATSVEDLVRADRTTPLAVQATMPATRGKIH